ncbi:MAG TPA: carboxypeptidase-like regulatory domain-containing protein [Saprospiraceae bacterium]|nr:carboxypeptidase-like regulatory domain-containing protein [Saprospiraceae bacterium]
MASFPDRISTSLSRCFLSVLFLALFFTQSAQAQNNKDSVHVVQISGKVITDQNNNPVGIPYAVVAVVGSRRGTFSDFNGFFSIVVRNGETLVFSVLGFKDAYYHVPDTLTRDRYTLFQILTTDTILLPEAVIYPWPDPDYFNQQFLAMDVHEDLEDIAAENLSEKAMTQLRENLPSDGPENTSYYLRQQSKNLYYVGQIRTPQILNAFAWKEFIQAWKRGDFKKKKK